MLNTDRQRYIISFLSSLSVCLPVISLGAHSYKLHYITILAENTVNAWLHFDSSAL